MTGKEVALDGRGRGVGGICAGIARVGLPEAGPILWGRHEGIILNASIQSETTLVHQQEIRVQSIVTHTSDQTVQVEQQVGALGDRSSRGACCDGGEISPPSPRF